MRDIKSLTKDVQRTLISAIEALKVNPRPHGVEKLRGHPNFFRIRVGDYRVVYALPQTGLVVVCIVKHRKGSYNSLDDLSAKLAHALRELIGHTGDDGSEARIKA